MPCSGLQICNDSADVAMNNTSSTINDSQQGRPFLNQPMNIWVVTHWCTSYLEDITYHRNWTEIFSVWNEITQLLHIIVQILTVFLQFLRNVLRNSPIDGLVQDCSNSIANALELLQSCTKPSICYYSWSASHYLIHTLVTKCYSEAEAIHQEPHHVCPIHTCSYLNRGRSI